MLLCQHHNRIPLGVKGELSKIQEELAELQDVQQHGNGHFHGTLECADLLESIGQFAWRYYRIPFVCLIGIYLLRAVFKPIRNKVLDFFGHPKESFFVKEVEGANRMNDWLSDNDYRAAYSLVPRLCIDLVIRKPQGVLLVQRTSKPQIGAWHMPGGRVRLRESLDAAAERIGQTELGTPVSLEQLLGYAEYLHDIGDLGDFHSVSLVFAVSANLPSTCPGEFFTKASEEMLPIHRQFLVDHHFLKAQSKSGVGSITDDQEKNT